MWRRRLPEQLHTFPDCPAPLPDGVCDACYRRGHDARRRRSASGDELPEGQDSADQFSCDPLNGREHTPYCRRQGDIHPEQRTANRAEGQDQPCACLAKRAAQDPEQRAGDRAPAAAPQAGGPFRPPWNASVVGGHGNQHDQRGAARSAAESRALRRAEQSDAAQHAGERNHPCAIPQRDALEASQDQRHARGPREKRQCQHQPGDQRDGTGGVKAIGGPFPARHTFLPLGEDQHRRAGEQTIRGEVDEASAAQDRQEPPDCQPA